MKATIAQDLHNALTEPNIQLKNLSVDPYMKTIRLIKKLALFLDERASDIQTLITEYNKEFNEKIKSQKFKDAAKKKEEELTAEETELLSIRPPVQALPNNMLSGPEDFIEKVNAINNRELKFKKDELNYVGDGKVFKALAENVSPQHQTILYDHLFKQ